MLCAFDRFVQSTNHAALLVDHSPVQQSVDSTTIDWSRMPSPVLSEVALAPHAQTAAPSPQPVEVRGSGAKVCGAAHPTGNTHPHCNEQIKSKYKLTLTHCNANSKFLNYCPSNAAPAKCRPGLPPSLTFPPPLAKAKWSIDIAGSRRARSVNCYVISRLFCNRPI